MASIFISRDDFYNSKEEQVEEKILSWRDFPTGEVYKVLSLKFLISKFNKECRLLTVANKRGDITKVWISRELASKLAQKEPKQIPFIISLGQEPRGAYKVNIYEISFKISKTEYQILYEDEPKEEEISQDKLLESISKTFTPQN